MTSNNIIKLTSNRGIGLIELLVGLAVSVLVLSIIGQVFSNTRLSYQTQEAMARIQENARIAIQALNEDIRMAGFIGATQRYWMTQETDQPTNDLTNVSGECFTAAGSNTYRWAAPMIAINPLTLPPKLFGKDNTNSDFTGCISTTNYVSNTDILSIHYAGLPRWANADLEEDYFYLRSNMLGAAAFTCGSSGGMGMGMGMGAGAIVGATCLQPAFGGGGMGTFTVGGDVWGGVGTPDPTPETANYQIEAVAYYIRKCLTTGVSGTCSDGDNIPTLFRARIEYNVANCSGNDPCVVHEPIAEGVVSMHIEYGIDTVIESGALATGTVIGSVRAGLPDGHVDRYYTANNIAGGNIFSNSALETWNNVITARIWLLIRSQTKEAGYSDPKSTYTMAGTTVNTEAGYRYQLFSTTVSMRNFSA